MSLWYDLKNKVYSSGPMDNWYVAHLKKVCSNLTDTITNLLSSHTGGTSGRHKCDHIDYNDTSTLQDFLNCEKTERQEADQSIKTTFQEALNNESIERDRAFQVLNSTIQESIYDESLKRDEADTTLSSNLYEAINNEKLERNEADQNLNSTLQEAINNEISERKASDQSILSQAQELVLSEEASRKEDLSLKVDKVYGKELSSNDYTNEEKEIVAKTAGTKVEGKKFSDILIESNGTPYLTPTTLSNLEGSEVFNDYSTNQAYGIFSHAEGQYTIAKGDYSHAEGILTKAIGNKSHAEGYLTCASSQNQHAQGVLNIEDTEDKYAHIVGNGHIVYNPEENTETHIRSNAHTVDWDGNGWFSGDVFCGDLETGLQAQITALYNKRPNVMTETADILSANTIYDLGLCDSLTLTLPDGNMGDWIKVDFISGDTPTELSLITDKISDHSIIPDANTAYSLIFDWGKLTADTYGWRFSYSEYTKAVTA